jgi:hypothetical protein
VDAPVVVGRSLLAVDDKTRVGLDRSRDIGEEWGRVPRNQCSSRLEWTFCRVFSICAEGIKVPWWATTIEDLVGQIPTYTMTVGQMKNVKRVWRRRMRMMLTELGAVIVATLQCW